MYIIKYGDEILHDPRDEERTVKNAKAELAVNESGRLTFNIQPNHPLCGKLKPMNRDQEVILEQDGVEIFRGRILSMKEGFYGDADVTCEGELAYLNDITVREYSTGKGDVPSTIDGFFGWLVAQYNNRNDERFRFIVGINDGWRLDPSNKIARDSSDTPNVAQEMKEKLLNSIGGYVRVRHMGGNRYIDYLASGDNAATQKIEFGSNLLDFTRDREWADYYNVIIPRGGQNKGGQSGYVDISGEPDRELAGGLSKHGDRIIDNDGAREYGYIERVVDFEGVKTPSELVDAAARHMRNMQVGDILEVTAIDLSMIDKGISPIYIGDFVRVTSKPHGYDEYFICSKMTIDVSNPANNTFTFGNEYGYMTGQQMFKLAALNASINKTFEETTKLTEEAKKAAQDAKDAASSAVTEVLDEYTVTNSRTTKPSDGAVWVKEPPVPGTGEFVWKRTVTTYGDGTSVTGQPVLLTGESVAAVEITTTNGAIIRNRKGSTTLQAAVLYGGDRITDKKTLESYFGAGASLQWNENDDGTFVVIGSDDPRLSNDGFSLKVDAANIVGDASYMCLLMTTM